MPNIFTTKGITVKSEQQILKLLLEILQATQALAHGTAAPKRKPSRAEQKATPKGIRAHQSKYNPWRATVWDKELHASVELGAFPSIAQAKAAQAAYRRGDPITTGTRATKPRPALALAKRAA